MGVPTPLILVMVARYSATHFESGKRVTGDLEALLGRPPTSMRQYIADHASFWYIIPAPWQDDQTGQRSSQGHLLQKRPAT